MPAYINLHRITEAKAEARGDTEWLALRDGSGTEVNIFIPLHIAHAFADAFTMHQRNAEAVRRIKARQMEGAEQ